MQVSRHWDDDDVKTQTATGNALFWDLTACERKKKNWKQKFSRFYSSEIIGLRRNNKDGQVTKENIQQWRHEVRLV